MPSSSEDMPVHPYLHPIRSSRSRSDQAPSASGIGPNLFFGPDTTTHAGDHGLGITGMSYAAPLHPNTEAPVPQDFSRLFQFEQQCHQLTLDALNDRNQRVQVLEERLKSQANESNRWAWSYSQCFHLLKQRDSEIQRLESRVQVLESRVSWFRL